MTEAKLRLRVQPRAKKDEVAGLVGDAIRVRVSAPAIEGRANEAVIELLAKTLKVRKGQIRLLRGATSHDKVVSIEGIDTTEAVQRLGLASRPTLL